MNNSNDTAKKAAAEAAFSLLEPNMVLGIGTGTTVEVFLNLLQAHNYSFKGAVSSSHRSTIILKKMGVPVYSLNAAFPLDLYIDGTDAFNEQKQLLKGKGGAFTLEKIIATVARRFICITDDSKPSKAFGLGAVPIEVVPEARSYVARILLAMGANPLWRQDIITDSGNHIIDAYELDLSHPIALESELNNIEGVVAHGLFAKRRADDIFVGSIDGSVLRY